MYRSFITSVLALLISAPLAVQASASPAPSPAPTPTMSPYDLSAMEIAKREFVAWQAGDVDKDRYSSAIAGELTDDQIAQTSKTLSEAGPLERTQLDGRYAPPADVPGGHSYVYRMICANKTLFELLTLAPDGKIAGIQFRDHFD